MKKAKTANDAFKLVAAQLEFFIKQIDRRIEQPQTIHDEDEDDPEKWHDALWAERGAHMKMLRLVKQRIKSKKERRRKSQTKAAKRARVRRSDNLSAVMKREARAIDAWERKFGEGKRK